MSRLSLLSPRTSSMTFPPPIEVSRDQLDPPPDDSNAVQKNLIGKGAFGIVYKAVYTGLGAPIPVAVKKLILPALNADDPCYMELRREAGLMCQTKHPNIARCFGAILDPKNASLIMELLPKSLWILLYESHKSGRVVEAEKKFPWSQRLHIAHGIAAGMAYLHSLTPPLAHRDLKAGNVLLDDDLNPKLIDFGMARIKAESARISTVSGTPQWMPPESFETDRFDPLKADVYSYGMCLYELFTGKVPFHEVGRVPVIIKKICDGVRPSVGPRGTGCPQTFVELMQRCWHQNPKQRPSFSEIIQLTSTWNLTPVAPIARAISSPDLGSPPPTQKLADPPATLKHASAARAESALDLTVSKPPDADVKTVTDAKAVAAPVLKFSPLSKPKCVLLFGSKGVKEGEFQFPHGICVDQIGRIFVADSDNHRIQVFDSHGKFLFKFGSKGSGDGQFQQPEAVAVNSAGEVVVVERDNHRVQILDSTGKYLRKFGSQGSGNGQFFQPQKLAVDKDDRIIVPDWGNNRVQVFDTHGKFLFGFGGQGVSNGRFRGPWCAATTPENQILIADQWNHRIQVFDSQGNFIRKIGTEGKGDGEFTCPYGVAAFGTTIVVADTQSFRLQFFDANSGKFVGKFGRRGNKELEFENPSSVAVSPLGHLLVLDTNNYRVQGIVFDG